VSLVDLVHLAGSAEEELKKFGHLLRLEHVASVPTVLNATSTTLLHEVVSALFNLELFVPSGIDSSLRLKFRQFSLDFLISKWNALALVVKPAAMQGLAPDNATELLENVISAAQVANRAYVNNVMRVARWILPLAARKSLGSKFFITNPPHA
jgi:hypothetical protein